MSSAQANAKVKSDAGSCGVLSAALGGMGGIGNLMKMGTHRIDKINETKENAARKSANDSNGKKYIDEKAASLMKESDAQADHMTEVGARLIVAQRLGVQDPANYEEVYKKLSERRADRILNKEEGYLEVLAAMGLTEDADKSTILEVLGVS